ncbi:ribonucleotide-diphosphate reductase subunit alpha, partial [Vibrio cholerae O1]|nr:ribonucleotide-diphosphate reductase subunit alpha [Vibrio cholerae O1]
KRENADEKVRIKSLSLGVIVPDITFKLEKENKDMALFSPYDIEKEYKCSMADMSITEKYDELVNNPRIKKDYISARKFFQTIAELQFESGYPYILFEDTVNRRN